MAELGEYTIAWAVYIAAALGLLLVSARIFRGISWRYLRHSLWLILAVILFTPATAVEGYWAPAWIMGILEALFGGNEKALDITRIIGYLAVAVIGLYTIISVIWRLRTGPAKSEPKTNSHDQKNNKKTDKQNTRVTPHIS